MIPETWAAASEQLRADLQRIFGGRLQALVAYGPALFPPSARPAGWTIASPDETLHTMALVDRVQFGDLTACARQSRAWSKRRLAMPLLLGTDEFTHSLDAFPLEYGDIITHHVLVAGQNPFIGVSVRPEDRRRACEVQAKSHLIHLREGYLEAEGAPARVARLITASSASFGTLLRNVADLQGATAATPAALAATVQDGLGLPAGVVERIVSLNRPDDLPASEAAELYPKYLEAAERLWRFLDGWSAGRETPRRET